MNFRAQGSLVPNRASIAQGTIEYLIIIAVVVVIALAVSVVLLTQNENAILINEGLNQYPSTNVGGIVISDSVLSSTGDAVISLKNETGKDLNITQLVATSGGVDGNISLNCNGELRVGHEKNCLVLDVNTLCPCTGNNTVTCYYKIKYTYSTGLEEEKTFTIQNTCTSTAQTYTLNYTTTEGGTISGTTIQKIILGGNGTSVTAIPNEGYEFVKWSDDATNPTRTEYNVTENKNLQAIFNELSCKNNYDWIQLDNPLGTTQLIDISVSADGETMAIIANTYLDNQILVSTNGGESWEPKITPSFFTKIALSSDGTKIYGINETWSNGYIWVSTNFGTDWVQKATANEWKSLAVSSDGTKVIALPYRGNIFLSINSGDNWTEVTNNRYWKDVVSSSDGTGFVAVSNGTTLGSPGYIWISTNSGETWTQGDDLNYWEAVRASSNLNKIIVSNGHFRFSSDNGESWILSNEKIDGNIGTWNLAVSDDGTKLVILNDYYPYYPVYTNGEIYTSIDSGETWVKEEEISDNWSSMDSTSNGTIFAVTNQGKLYTGTPLETCLK